MITRRSKEKAILLDYDEYVRLKALAEKAKEDRLIEALEKIQQAVAEAGISYEAVTEAIHVVRLPRRGTPICLRCLPAPGEE
ncbi:MAG: hypothetical protein K6U04_15480 [Armatimonadetes bacterium]|nr:hypothetical protein [Armatimonadota bacterium]